MGILAQDTFAGRSVSGSWGTASDGHTWAQLDGVGLILSVGSGEGKGHAGNHDTQMLLGSGTATDQEGLVRLALGQIGDSIGLLLRCDATGANYYFSEIGNFGNDITIYKVIGGAKTNLNVFAAGITISNGSFYWMRFQVIGTTIKTKIWADGSSEPASWAGSVTDSSIASGQYGIYLNSFGSIDAQFDSYQANDTQVGGTASLSGTLAGVGTLSGAPSYSTALADTLAGAGTLSGAFSLATSLTAVLRGTGTLTVVTGSYALERTTTWKTRDLATTWKTRDLETTWRG